MAWKVFRDTSSEKMGSFIHVEVIGEKGYVVCAYSIDHCIRQSQTSRCSIHEESNQTGLEPVSAAYGMVSGWREVQYISSIRHAWINGTNPGRS